MAANGTSRQGSSGAATVAELVQAQWGDHRVGAKYGDLVLTHHELAGGAAARAALLGELLPHGARAHLGVLLGNVPEYPLWLSAAALAGAAVAGINPTRRGPELARDISHTDCALLITERAHLPLLAGLDLPVPPERILVVDDPAYRELLAPYEGTTPDEIAMRLRRHPHPDARLPDAPLLHLRLHRCTQGRPLLPGPAWPPPGTRWPDSSGCAGTTSTISVCRCSTATR